MRQRAAGGGLSEGRILRGGGSHISYICISCAVSGDREEAGNWKEGGDGAGSRRELKASLKTVSGLSYNFRKGGREDFTGISEVPVAFYAFLLSLVSGGQNGSPKALFSLAFLI